MELIEQKTANNIKAFSKMLDDTEHMNGLVLKIYEEFIVDYVTVWADEIGWEKVTGRLNNPESGLSKQVDKLIGLINDAAKADGYATCLEIEQMDRYDYNVDDVKQYDTMEQAEGAWDKAVELARDMQAKDIRITKAEFLADIVDFGIKTVKLWDL